MCVCFGRQKSLIGNFVWHRMKQPGSSWKYVNTFFTLSSVPLSPRIDRPAFSWDSDTVREDLSTIVPGNRTADTPAHLGYIQPKHAQFLNLSATIKPKCLTKSCAIQLSTYIALNNCTCNLVLNCLSNSPRQLSKKLCPPPPPPTHTQTNCKKTCNLNKRRTGKPI